MSLNYKLKRRASHTLLSLAIAASPLGLVAVASTPGCLFGSGGPSAVGQGKQYQSGDPTFDEYFQSLYDLQVELAKAPSDEKEIRRELAKQLKGDPDASATLLAKRAEKRAKELATAGTGLKAEVSGLGEGDPAAEINAAGNDLDADGKEFVDAVKAAIVSQAKLHNRMKKAGRIIEKLSGMSAALEQQVDGAFRKSVSQKGEVRKNLADAKKLLPIMQARADEVASNAETAVKKLIEAVNTDDGSFNKPPPPPPPPPPEDPTGETGNGDKPKSGGGDKPKSGGGDKPKSGGGDKPKSGGGPPPPPPPPPPGDFEP